MSWSNGKSGAEQTDIAERSREFTYAWADSAQRGDSADSEHAQELARRQYDCGLPNTSPKARLREEQPPSGGSCLPPRPEPCAQRERAAMAM
ncbi:MAG: hypothetical protein ACOH1J_07905 [Microbacteriaceae bacterium]